MSRWWMVALLLIFVLSHRAHAADSIGGSAQISWRSTSTEADGEEESSHDLNQMYNINLNKEITSKLSFAADLGISSTKTEDGDTTRLFPQFRFNIVNEYFDANWGWQLNERGVDLLGMSSDEDRLTTQTWTGNFSTKSERYPEVRLRYDKTRDYDDLSPHKKDTRSEVHEEALDYTYKFVDITAKHFQDTTDNFVNESTQTTTNNEVRTQFAKSFWENRISTSGSYRWTGGEDESVTRGQDIDLDREREARTGLYAEDTTPMDGELFPEGGLIDGDLVTRTSSAINIGAQGSDRDHNVGVELYDQNEVEKIYIYTDSVYTDNDRNPVEWDVYEADDNLVTTAWQAVAGVNCEYVEDERRFELSFAPVTGKYFKVVNATQASLEDLYVTEIELFGVITQSAYTTDTTEITRENIILNVGARPMDWLHMTYYFTEDEDETDSDSSSEKTRQTSHNISVRGDADLSEDLGVWAQYQRRIEDDSANTERTAKRTTDTYSLQFDYLPLDTLNSSLSFNHSVPREGSETQSRTSTSLLHLAAEPYKGVDLTMDGNINYTDNLVSDTQTLTKSFDSDLRLKLTRALTAEFRYTRNRSTTQTRDAPDTFGSDFNFEWELSYRPIQSLYFRSSYELQSGEGGEWTGINRYDINWIMTEKLRFNLNYRESRTPCAGTSYSSDSTWNHLTPIVKDYDGAHTRAFSPDLTWNLSKIFVLRFQYNWSRDKTDEEVTESEIFTAILSARF